MELLFLLLILAVLAPLLSSRVSSGRHRNYHSQWTLPQEQSTTSAASQAEADTLSYDKAYQKKWLLTMNEKAFYRQLCSFATKKNMTVFTKVRLLDLLEPVKISRNTKPISTKCRRNTLTFCYVIQSWWRGISSNWTITAILRQIVQNEISLSIQSCKQSDTRFCVLMLSMK